MMAPTSGLDGLKRRRPEWAPWLAVIEEILRETGARRWETAVPLVARLGAEAPGAKAAERQATAPLLSGAELSLQPSSIRRLVKRLIRVAALGGTAKMGTLAIALDPDLDVLTLFTAALCQEGDRVKEVAAVHGADAEALQAVVALVPVPFLQACNRRWASSISESWVEGYCPVCGSWPAFAEVRGIERRRYFRCGRCGGEWHAESLSCPYCAIRDHNELVALVPEKDGSHAVIDACKRCLGYVKTFTRLQGCPPDTIMLEDLASVDLDVAALEQGYTRPPDAGYRLDVTVRGNGAPRRFFAWNA
jgi:FdhE protein